MTKGPRPVQSGFPKDKRPPKRGKSGSPLATGSAKSKASNDGTPKNLAPVGTSQSGKPTAASDLSAIPSTDASRKRADKPEPIQRARKLNEREVRERETNLAKKYSVIRGLEKEKKRITQDLSGQITKHRKEADKWADEIEQKRELLAQDEIDFDGEEELAAGSSTPTTGQTDAALGEIARHVGGNGAPKDEQDPAPKIDNALAGAVRIEANRPEPKDDIERAAAADLAGAHA